MTNRKKSKIKSHAPDLPASFREREKDTGETSPYLLFNNSTNDFKCQAYLLKKKAAPSCWLGRRAASTSGECLHE